MRFWKIKRELRRAYLQALSLAEPILGTWQRRRYDLRKAKLVAFHAGAGAMHENVAVFLLYQPKGVLDSTLETCRYLVRNGYTVLIVSNAPVSAADRARLLPLCHTLMERPNFGYDFGGYRDGVLHVLNSGWQPENLLVLNDSVWFPVLENCDFLLQVKTQTAEIFGPILSHGHLHSYMYNFKRRLVTSDFFRNYWQELPMTNNKVSVVQRCEKSLSPVMQKAGFSLGWFASNAESVNAICDLPDDELAEVIAYDKCNDNSLGRAFAGFSLCQPNWRKMATTICKRNILKRNILKDHPLVLLRDLQVPVLKKDRALQYARQRRALLASPLAISLESAVLMELQTWDGQVR